MLDDEIIEKLDDGHPLRTVKGAFAIVFVQNRSPALSSQEFDHPHLHFHINPILVNSAVPIEVFGQFFGHFQKRVPSPRFIWIGKACLIEQSSIVVDRPSGDVDRQSVYATIRTPSPHECLRIEVIRMDFILILCNVFIQREKSPFFHKLRKIAIGETHHV